MPPPANRPIRPDVIRTATPTTGAYENAGVLTSQQLIDGDADRYAWLDSKILEIVRYVQQTLVQNNRADDIDKARKDPQLRAAMAQEIDRIAFQYLLKERGIRGEEGKIVVASVVNDILGLGPLEPLWDDPAITEVIVNGPNSVYVEREGQLQRAKGCRFRSQEHLLEVCQRILSPLNRKIDVRDALADGRLPDGSRVNVVHQALAPNGPLLTIRRFPESNRSLIDLVEIGSLDPDMATLLATLVENRASILVSGGTGSGKALDITTPIPTPTGFIPMGDLQVGDTVFDEHGLPTTVTGAYDVQHNRTCYEVSFSDGSSIVADEDHLWTMLLTAAETTVEVVLETRHLKDGLRDGAVWMLPNRIFTDSRCAAPPQAFEDRHVTAIVEVPSRPVRCIRVDNPTHLYLAGTAYIPTHNTTLLNALSAAIPKYERLVTIEDSLELRLAPEAHVAALEARPPDSSGHNAITIRQLVKNALRMRPDRIIVGEIRDSAALDMLQACNTGHEGSMSTVHANGPNEAVSRLSVMVAQGGEIPADKVDWLVGSAIDLIVTARRYEDGSRRVSGIYEVPDLNNLEDGETFKVKPLWEWVVTHVNEDGRLEGEYRKVGEMSEVLRRAKGLDTKPHVTWDRLRSMCGLPPEPTPEPNPTS